MKSHEQAASESTCQKRVTITEIYDSAGNLLARESNRCNPSGGTCHRLDVIQGKGNYSVDCHCNWTHSEINAIAALPTQCKPYKAICYGHTFFCDSCEKALKDIGVVEFNVSPHVK